MLAEDFVPWQDKLAVFITYDGERTTAHILFVDLKRNELIVDALTSNRPYPESDHRGFIIPVGSIVSVGPAPSGLQARRPTPPPDPCRIPQPLSGSRFAVLAGLFFTMIPGGVILLFLTADWPYGVQLASIIMYTAAVALYTFSSNKGQQPYLLSCPVVHNELSRLLKRHVGFLAALVLFLTAALQIRPHLSNWWITSSARDESPFVVMLFIFGGCLAVTQIISNRSLLERAHLQFDRH